MITEDYEFSSEHSVITLQHQIVEIYPELANTIDKFYLVVGSNDSLTRHSTDEYVHFISSKILEGKKIIFDIRAETILTNLYERIHEIIEKINVQHQCFFSLCGAIDGEEAYKNFHHKRNYKQYIQVISLHHFEKLMRDMHSEVNQPQFSIKPKEKQFLCFNKIERYQRLHLYAHSVKYNWFEKSFYSFEGSIPNFLDNKILSFKKSLNKDTCYPYMEYWVRDILEKTKHQFPIKLNITEERNNPINVNEEDMYYFENSYISIVTETIFYKVTEKYNGLTVFNYEPAYKFLTEKTFKPIVAKHPFISVGFTGILEFLKERGYKTFHPYIDETYDMIDDDYERMNYITNEILRLSKFSESDWMLWQEGVKDIVEYNYNHFFSKNKNYRHTPWNENWIK